MEEEFLRNPAAIFHVLAKPCSEAQNTNLPSIFFKEEFNPLELIIDLLADLAGCYGSGWSLAEASRKKKTRHPSPCHSFVLWLDQGWDGAGVAAGDHGTKSSDHFGRLGEGLASLGFCLWLSLAKFMPSTTKPPLFSPLIQVICVLFFHLKNHNVFYFYCCYCPLTL
jgi:hypothetical protein